MPGWMTKNKNPKTQNEQTPILRKKDVTATQGMLFGVRDQLRAEILSVKEELSGSIQSVKSELKREIDSLRNETKQDIDALRTEVRVGFHDLKADIHRLSSVIHRLGVIFEEQNARNAIVLDGYASLFERQERVEKKLDGEI